jgi:hypothetical protein
MLDLNDSLIFSSFIHLHNDLFSILKLIDKDKIFELNSNFINLKL